MASFAKIGLNSKVIEVLSVSDEVLKDSNGIEREINGIDFLTKLTGWAIWKQTSYNTKGGKYYNQINNIFIESDDQSKSFRKNHAGIGFTYDETRDAFIAPKPFNSWILNEDTCNWNAPINVPNEELEENQYYSWNESIINWEIKTR
jgi:hypothetical protein